MSDNLQVKLVFSGFVILTHDSYLDPNGTEERAAIEAIADEELSQAISEMNRRGWRVERSTYSVGVMHRG